ncbi:MAG: Zn-dependent hydrolase [Candidatus Methylacidiphilales bacterium]
MQPVIDLPRLVAEMDALALHSETAPPAVTRLVFSPEDRAARAMVTSLFEEAGLNVRTDAVGNTFARWEGSDPDRGVFATGSHIDAIPNAGKFDGVVGVLGAIEAVRSLRAVGFQPSASIEIILFTSEEPTRFGLGCLGSRLLSRQLDPGRADALTDGAGKTLAAWRAEAGFTGDLTSVPLKQGAYAGFIELHIEQGPILEREKMAIGAVEKIAAPAALRLRLEGEGGHAGAVLMPDRRDACLGGAEVALAVERLVTSLGSPDGVGTTGVFTISPGAINSIPFEAVLEIDLRDTDHAARQAVEEQLRKEIEAVASRRGLSFSVETINSDPPAVADPGLVMAVETAAAEEGVTCRRMISRAYHDSLFMALVAPTSMIFIPCRNGYSHRPDEYTEPEAVRAGVAVLARTLAHLAA